MNVAETASFADDIRIWLDERADVFLVLKEKPSIRYDENVESAVM